jgi:hypothetical protein
LAVSVRAVPVIVTEVSIGPLGGVKLAMVYWPTPVSETV